MMKTDLPKRRLQQQRSRQFWRAAFVFAFIALISGTIGFFAYRHRATLVTFANERTEPYRKRISAWAESKQSRLKSEVVRFKGAEPAASDDVQFHFYSDLSSTGTNEAQTTSPKQQPTLMTQKKTNRPLQPKQPEPPDDDLIREFEHSLPHSH